MKLGKTNDYPQGKLSESDEGGLKIAIGVKNNAVIIEFGTSIKWIGFDKATALALAMSLIQKANSL